MYATARRRATDLGRAGDTPCADRVASIIDTENLTEREPGRSLLAVDKDGVLADYLIYHEKVLGKLPPYLYWVQASIIHYADVTGSSALKGVEIGHGVLIQGE